MSPSIKEFAQTWVINVVAVLLAAHVVNGISYETPVDLLVATLLLSVLNAVIRPLLVVISLPLVLLSLGLFILVINAGLLWFVGGLVKGFHVATFWAACKGAVLMAITNLALNSLTHTGTSRVKISGRRKTSGPPPRNDQDVIDV